MTTRPSTRTVCVSTASGVMGLPAYVMGLLSFMAQYRARCLSRTWDVATHPLVIEYRSLGPTSATEPREQTIGSSGATHPCDEAPGQHQLRLNIFAITCAALYSLALIVAPR